MCSKHITSAQNDRLNRQVLRYYLKVRDDEQSVMKSGIGYSQLTGGYWQHTTSLMSTHVTIQLLMH